MERHLSALLLTLALLVLSIWSLFLGVIDMNLSGLLSGELEQPEVSLISCLPCLLAALYTGVGVGVAGLIIQQLCMNKFISSTTGATISSAQLGILLALLSPPSFALQGRAFPPFVFAVLGTWIFAWFIQRIQLKDMVVAPLVDIMFGSVIGGLISYLAYQYETIQTLPTWTVGHFPMVLRGRYELVYLIVPLVTLVFSPADHFDIVGMGKDFSKNLGVPYNLVLFLRLTITAMIIVNVTVIVGSISYIGLIVLNVVAMFEGGKIRSTLIDTALFGVVFMLGYDMIGWVVITPYGLPIKLIVGILGNLTFVVLLLHRLRRDRKAIRPTEGGAGCDCTPATYLDGGDAA